MPKILEKVRGWRVVIPPVTDAMTYQAALHELGHVAAERLLRDTIETPPWLRLIFECAAWCWASARSLVPPTTAAVLDAQIALETYALGYAAHFLGGWRGPAAIGDLVGDLVHEVPERYQGDLRALLVSAVLLAPHAVGASRAHWDELRRPAQAWAQYLPVFVANLAARAGLPVRT